MSKNNIMWQITPFVLGAMIGFVIGIHIAMGLKEYNDVVSRPEDIVLDDDPADVFSGVTIAGPTIVTFKVDFENIKYAIGQDVFYLKFGKVESSKTNGIFIGKDGAVFYSLAKVLSPADLYSDWKVQAEIFPSKQELLESL